MAQFDVRRGDGQWVLAFALVWMTASLAWSNGYYSQPMGVQQPPGIP
jgi:hypothetical protein